MPSRCAPSSLSDRNRDAATRGVPRLQVAPRPDALGHGAGQNIRKPARLLPGSRALLWAACHAPTSRSQRPLLSSLRAQRSNPENHQARTGLLRRFAPRDDEDASRQQKAALEGAAFEIQRGVTYAASDSPPPCTGPESLPLASTSRSTNSITAIGALSP